MNNNQTEILKIQLLTDIMDSLKIIERLIIEKSQQTQQYDKQLSDIYKKYDALNRQFRSLAPILKDEHLPQNV